MSKKQIQGPGSAPDFARGTGAPKQVHAHERARSKAMDPSRGRAPDSGQTKGGGPNKKGSGGE